MSQVELSVRTELDKVIEQLTKLKNAASEVSAEVKSAGADTGESLNKQVKHTETFFSKLRGNVRRVADQMRGDFKALISVQSLAAGMKLSGQFSGSIRETVNLSDAVRKLGSSFGVAAKDYDRFQNKLTKGMGEIGLSSEEAAQVLKGLAGTGVMGEGAVTSYAQTAGQLASLGGEKGRGGEIAKLLAETVRAKGGNVSDPAQMQAIAKAVTQAMEVTGRGASDVLGSINKVFQAMPSEMRKAVTPQGLAQLSVAEMIGGPGATSAMQKYLGMDEIQRQALKAQGFGNVFTTEGGINAKALKDFLASAKSRGLDARSGLKTFGFSEEEAEGLVRLGEQSDRLADALERTAKASDDYAAKTRKNMGMAEAFQASVNKIKAVVAGPLSYVTQGLTDVLGGASESTAGAVAVTGGAAALAAILTGGGLKGIGGALGGKGGIGGLAMGEAKRQIREELTGRKVQDVYVTNADEISGGALGAAAQAGSGLLGKAGMLVKGAAGVGGAALAGYEVGSYLNKYLEENTQGKTSEGFEGNLVERLIFKLDKLVGGESSRRIMQAQEIHVKLSKELETTKQPRGASIAPNR